MKTIGALLVVLCLNLPFADDGWNIFARVKFKPKYSKAHAEYFLFPQFEKDIRLLEGTEVSLRGHYIPFDLPNPDAIVLSKNPYAACFFCGGAGPESVAEVVFRAKKPKLRPDQVLTVRGKLKLNATDTERMTFIVEDATVVK